MALWMLSGLRTWTLCWTTTRPWPWPTVTASLWHPTARSSSKCTTLTMPHQPPCHAMAWCSWAAPSLTGTQSCKVSVVSFPVLSFYCIVYFLVLLLYSFLYFYCIVYCMVYFPVLLLHSLLSCTCFFYFIVYFLVLFFHCIDTFPVLLLYRFLSCTFLLL